jgi:hypothetical protein
MMHSFFMQSLRPGLAKLLQEEDPPAKQTNKQSIYKYNLLLQHLVESETSHPITKKAS